jgi:two-component system response regulator PilR (NtrC family)
MKIHTAPRDGDTTLIVSSTRTHHGSEVVPGLTVLWHPQIERIGDRVAIAAGAKGMALSRTTPPFCAPGHEHGTPLHHRCVSRSPLTLTVQADGELRIDLPDTRMQCRLNGETLLDSRIIPAAEIDRGLVLQLGGAIMLCIHWLDAASQPAAHSALVGYSRAMAAIQRTIVRVAAVDAPVLIVGETGTGKELVAQAIHARSARAHAPLVAVNMATLTESLAATDLFGATKGAYTGAANARQGLFAEADGGTLFLDEVAELPLTMQVKLLRAIQEKRVRKVGATGEEAVDVRVICATHQDLKALVEQGRFRQDLFYRLNVIELRMPALRECREDIPALAQHILERLARTAGLVPPPLAAPALAALQSYPFPGNVRELENVLERALALMVGDRIDAADLNLAPAQMPGVAPATAGGSLQDHLDHVERHAILDALTQANNNRTAAARLLGVTFRSLRYRMARLGMNE